MPKRVDHHERRTRIADALLRLAASQGLEAVSLRHVAAEAGVSTGMVQHYFRTKDEMMTFALEVVGDNVQARLAARTESAGEAATPRDVVRELLVQILPLDEPRRLEGHAALAFLAYTAVRPDIAAGLRQNTDSMRAFLADQIRAAHPSTAAARDPDRAAAALLALTDGLGMHALGRHLTPQEALATLDAHLDTVFGPEDQPGRP